MRNLLPSKLKTRQIPGVKSQTSNASLDKTFQSGCHMKNQNISKYLSSDLLHLSRSDILIPEFRSTFIHTHCLPFTQWRVPPILSEWLVIPNGLSIWHRAPGWINTLQLKGIGPHSDLCSTTQGHQSRWGPKLQQLLYLRNVVRMAPHHRKGWMMLDDALMHCKTSPLKSSLQNKVLCWMLPRC